MAIDRRAPLDLRSTVTGDYRAVFAAGKAYVGSTILNFNQTTVMNMDDLIQTLQLQLVDQSLAKKDYDMQRGRMVAGYMVVNHYSKGDMFHGIAMHVCNVKNGKTLIHQSYWYSS